jgi:hypothetical protein
LEQQAKHGKVAETIEAEALVVENRPNSEKLQVPEEARARSTSAETPEGVEEVATESSQIDGHPSGSKPNANYNRCFRTKRIKNEKP